MHVGVFVPAAVGCPSAQRTVCVVPLLLGAPGDEYPQPLGQGYPGRDQRPKQLGRQSIHGHRTAYPHIPQCSRPGSYSRPHYSGGMTPCSWGVCPYVHRASASTASAVPPGGCAPYEDLEGSGGGAPHEDLEGSGGGVRTWKDLEDVPHMRT